MARTPFLLIATLLSSLVWAQSHAQNTEPYEADPPDRAARLSYLEGEVSLQPAGEQVWAPALLNRPLTTGDKVWAERDARAEIQVGPADVRLGGNTGFSFLNVDDDTIQMRMTAGVVYINVRTLRDSEQIEIDTPNVALSLLRAGSYRVEVNDAGDSTIVKVSEGAVQATGASQDVVVHAQQVATFNGVDNLVAQFGTLGAPDDFDSWNLERDRHDERAANSRTAEYVSPEVTGYEDLDDNGSWSSEPEYGYVWTPSYVAAGWAPYRYGRWVWVAPWGWNWIDDARWGYAPFHYGRWAHVRNRWCWVPGPRHVRAVYAPALVGWGAPHGGHVSWFPLGPREVYMPGRHFSRHYLERVNVANTFVNRMQVTSAFENRVREGVYRNRSAPDSVTTVSRDAFTSAMRTGAQRLRISPQDQAGDSGTAIAPRIDPRRESRLGGPVRANLRVPPSSLANRQVVVRRDPPAAAAHFARRTPDASVAQSEQGLRARPDRPSRTEAPRADFSPPVQSSVREPRTIAERVREDRDRQSREQQQQRSSWQPQDQGRREQWQAAREQQQQQQQLERVQRQREAVRDSFTRRPEQRERPASHERTEQPRYQSRPEQRPESRQEQPRAQQPRNDQPRAEQPRMERPQRSESRPAESRPQPRHQDGGNTRSKRD